MKIIKNEEFLIINDTYFGCDQEWYSAKWARQAGCGPTAATNLALYQLKRNNLSKEETVQMMETFFTFITPGFGGVNKILMFEEGISNYFKGSFDVVSLAVDKKKEKRIQYDELKDYLNRAIDDDQPVAFLNLSNGLEKRLDYWHWVTIVGYDDQTDEILFSDAGEKKSANIKLWFETTKNNGGFVRLKLKES